MKLIVILLAMGLFLSVAFASSTTIADARYAQIACEAQFSTTYATNLASIQESASPSNAALLKRDVDFVDSNLSALKTQIDAMGLQTKNSLGVLNDLRYKSSRLNQNLSALNSEVTKEQGFLKTSDPSAFQTLKSNYAEANQAYVQCSKTATNDLLQLKINAYNAEIANWNTKVSTLSGKGYAISGAQDILSGANTQVIVPLTQALSSGDYNTQKNALSDYCLFEGCKKVNFQLSAKMESAKLTSIFNKIKLMNLDADTNNEVVNAISKLTWVNFGQSSWGKEDYSIQKASSYWENLNYCSSALKIMIKTTEGGS